MSKVDYDAAVAAFLRNRAITHCPTACVAPTRTAVADPDRDALREYNAAREAARVEKISRHQERMAS
jgi:hypothetical protein